MKKLILSLLLIGFYAGTFAQSLEVFPEYKAAYEKGTRDISGKPGKKYWQNTADYFLNIDFNPTTRLLQGVVEINYVNNSPDVLKEIWFKLYPNLYKKGVVGKSRVAEADRGPGVQIEQMDIDGKTKNMEEVVVDGTNMVVPVNGLAPGKTLKFTIKYNYTLNKGSHVRTGQVDEGSSFIAYSFPRVAVYDDIDGWNKYPYNGDVEFYNDFCNFKVNIKVPQNFVVWATGDLLNVKDVFQPHIVDKFRRAEKSGAVIDVIDSADLQKGNVTVANPFNVFKFDAKNVTDFAFALSDHYLWKSKSLVVDNATGRRTRVDAVFNPKHKDYFEVIDFAWKTVEAMSFQFPKWPFPYNHETVFDGLDQMEYPMMVNDNPTRSKEEAITLTDHEIMHTMFPFYMGTNETKHAWMDEGWATIGEWLISPMIDSTIVDDYGISATASVSGTANDQPIMTLTTELNRSGSFTNNYPKPGFGYLYVKDYLGEGTFTKALHTYIKNWNGKHPMPYDFFYSMNTGADKNMDWFWKRWFFDGGVLDMGITAVNKTAKGYDVIVAAKSPKPQPIDLTITYEDGKIELLHRTIGVWESGNTSVTVGVTTPNKIAKVVLGSTYVPDKNKSDNTFVVN